MGLELALSQNDTGPPVSSCWPLLHHRATVKQLPLAQQTMLPSSHHHHRRRPGWLCHNPTLLHAVTTAQEDLCVGLPDRAQPKLTAVQQAASQDHRSRRVCTQRIVQGPLCRQYPVSAKARDSDKPVLCSHCLDPSTPKLAARRVIGKDKSGTVNDLGGQYSGRRRQREPFNKSDTIGVEAVQLFNDYIATT
jgi:hypothetical protein